MKRRPQAHLPAQASNESAALSKQAGRSRSTSVPSCAIVAR